MARGFDRNLQHRIIVGNTPAYGFTEPFTISIVYLRATGSPTTNQTLARYSAFALEPLTNQTVRTSTPVFGYPSTSPANEVLDAYNHAAGVWSANNNRVAWLNNGAGTANTETRESTTPTQVSIGNVLDNPTFGVTGNLAEYAFWDVALSNDEIKSLSVGFKPFRIRPQSLVAYVPLIRTAQELRHARTLTLNGTPTVATHPRVY